MKKNLNISYLNGAEGLHKRGGASSGGSSGGEGIKWEYYKVKKGQEYSDFPVFVLGLSQLVNTSFAVVPSGLYLYNCALQQIQPMCYKIGGNNAKIIYKDKEADVDVVIDKSSWYENVKYLFEITRGEDIEDVFNSYFTSISEEEFNSFEI